MVIKYDNILSENSERQDILRELSDIKRIISRYGGEFTLVLTENSLRTGANKQAPNLHDIKLTVVGGELADNVIYKRGDGKDIVLKGKCLCTGFNHRDNCSNKPTEIPF